MSLKKCDFNAAILLSSLSSNDLIWVFMSSECFGVAAVFNIGVVATFTIGVMLDKLNWDGWLSKSLLSEISGKISTSSSGGRFKTSVTGLIIL